MGCNRAITIAIGIQSFVNCNPWDISFVVLFLEKLSEDFNRMVIFGIPSLAPTTCSLMQIQEFRHARICWW